MDTHKNKQNCKNNPFLLRIVMFKDILVKNLMEIRISFGIETFSKRKNKPWYII